MQSSDLIGIWQLESRGAKSPADLGLKLNLKQFKDDGTYIELGVRLSQFQGLIPASRYRGNGTWMLDNNILEVSFDEGTIKSEITLINDVLDMVYISPKDDGGENIIVRHKRAVAPLAE